MGGRGRVGAKGRKGAEGLWEEQRGHEAGPAPAPPHPLPACVPMGAEARARGRPRADHTAARPRPPLLVRVWGQGLQTRARRLGTPCSPLGSLPPRLPQVARPSDHKGLERNYGVPEEGLTSESGQGGGWSGEAARVSPRPRPCLCPQTRPGRGDGKGQGPSLGAEPAPRHAHQATRRAGAQAAQGLTHLLLGVGA